MAHSDGIITAPVSFADVNATLGTSHTDLSAMCRDNNIKQWAKYRPVQYGTKFVGILTDAQRASVNYGITNIPVWSGSNSRIGNVVDVWVFDDSTSSKLPNGYSDIPSNGWWTRGLPTDAFRLADFVCGDDYSKGYFHRADPPIGVIDQAYINGGAVNIVYNMNTSGVTAGLTVTYSDLSALTNISYQNMYFGVCIVCGTKSSRTIYIATQDNKVGTIDGAGITLWSMGAFVRFKTNSTSGTLNTYLNNGTPFYVFPIITTFKNYVESSYITPFSGTGANETFIPLMPTESVSLEIFYVEGTILSFNVYSKPNQTDRKLYYSVSIKNNDSVNNRYFRYRVTIYDSNGTSLASTYPSSFQIAADDIAIFSGDNVYIDGGQHWRSAYSATVEVMPQVDVPHHDTSANTMVIHGELPRD